MHLFYLCFLLLFLFFFLYYINIVRERVVSMTKPYARSLNQNQYMLLLAIYSLRFSTRSVLSQYLGIANNTSLYSRLQILQKHGLIASHYHKDYKLAGREAEFYMLPKGLRELRDAERLEVSDAMITATYKDRSVGQDFIKQQVLLAKIRNKLVSTYDNLQAFTARDIQSLEYFPKPRPDLFLSMKNGDTVVRFFVEYIPAHAASSNLRKRLEYLSRYCNEDRWGETDTPFPAILFIAETGLAEAGIRRLISREQYHSGSDIVYYTTRQNAILSMVSDIHEVWTNVADPGNLLSLPEL